VASATNIILVALGFASVSAAVVFSRRRPLLVAFVSLGAVFFAAPFALHWYLTRDAYEWTIVVEREVDESADQRVIFVERIEWITDYEALKRQRGHVRSLLLDDDTTRKVWQVKGYVPVSIRAELLVGSSEVVFTRNFRDRGPGSYTFVLTIDENDFGAWSIEPGSSSQP